MGKFKQFLLESDSIKLSGFGKSSNSDAFKVIQKFESYGYPNPANDNQLIVDNVILELETLYGKLHLKYISSIKKGRGNGSMVLEDLINLCDDHEVDIIVHPKSVGETTQDKLVSWYKRFGFVDWMKGFMIKEYV